MKRYYRYNIKLSSGVDVFAKINADDKDKFINWASNTPGISEYAEICSVNKIGPHSSKKTKIAVARMQAGITQQELADYLGVRIQQVQRWEYAEFRPKTQVLMRIGEKLGVDWTTLIE